MMLATAKAPTFATTEAAWFWTMRCLLARRDGVRRVELGPVEPDVVVKVLDRLYRRRLVGLEHARVLRVCGEAQVIPSSGTGERRLWDEAMAALAGPLRLAGATE